MTDLLLNLLTAFLAAAASVLGIVVAVSQLTSASRLRRQATFWGEQSRSADSTYDRSVAQSLHRDATARIIALDAYPGKKILGPAFTTLVGLYGPIVVGYTVGSNSPNGLTLPNLSEQGIEPIVLVCVPILVMGIFGLASVTVRRRNLASKYLAAKDLAIEHPQQSDLEATVGLIITWRTFLGVCAFSLGISLLLTLFSFIAGMPKGDPSSFPSGWILAFVPAGFVLSLIGSSSVVNLFRQGPIAWHHPRKPKPLIYRPR